MGTAYTLSLFDPVDTPCMESELDVVQARVQWQTAQRDQQRALSDLIRSAVRIKTLMANMDMDGLAAIEQFWVRPSTTRESLAKTREAHKLAIR